jgi:hypothetical protein
MFGLGGGGEHGHDRAGTDHRTRGNASVHAAEAAESCVAIGLCLFHELQSSLRI